MNNEEKLIVIEEFIKLHGEDISLKKVKQNLLKTIYTFICPACKGEGIFKKTYKEELPLTYMQQKQNEVCCGGAWTGPTEYVYKTTIENCSLCNGIGKTEYLMKPKIETFQRQNGYEIQK
jgi:hypothetical protein